MHSMHVRSMVKIIPGNWLVTSSEKQSRPRQWNIQKMRGWGVELMKLPRNEFPTCKWSKFINRTIYWRIFKLNKDPSHCHSFKIYTKNAWSFSFLSSFHFNYSNQNSSNSKMDVVFSLYEWFPHVIDELCWTVTQIPKFFSQNIQNARQTTDMIQPPICN